MGQDRERYKELADFLKTRRKRLSPIDAGLPASERRRTLGLRREELAQIAGISPDWYTCLEQGRPVRVSAQVLEQIAYALRLSEGEKDYLFLLAHRQLPPVSGEEQHEAVDISPALGAVLENLSACPAYVQDYYLNIVAFNPLAKAVFGAFAPTNSRECNEAWSMFTRPGHRQLYADWEVQARLIVARLRTAYGRHMGDLGFRAFLAELTQASSEFRIWWHDYAVDGVTDGAVRLNHPQAGLLLLEQLTLNICGSRELSLKVYTPLPDTGTAEKLRELLA